MKKRIACLFVAVFTVMAMIMPAAASSYGEVVDTMGHTWEINHINHADGSTTSILRLSIADRLAILAQGLYPAYVLEQQLDSLSTMPENIDYYVRLRAVEPLRQNLLVFFPSQSTVIMRSDCDSLLSFAQKQLESPAFKALRSAMAPLEGFEVDELTAALKSAYSDQEMEEIYVSLEAVIGEYFADTDSAKLVTALQPITFQH